MRRALTGACLLVLLLTACTQPQPTVAPEARPRLPQLIQITVIPEPTVAPSATPTATAMPLPPTITPTPTPPPPENTPAPQVLSPARVSAFQVNYGEGFPVPVSLTVQGTFSDGCSQLGRVVQAPTAEGLALAVYATRPRDGVCALQERPFEMEIPLDITGLDVGVYTLTLNGIAGELRLELGQVVTHNPDLLCPAPAEGQKQARLERGGDSYCFDYPQDYSVVEGDAEVIVTARERSDVPVPLIGEVRISNLGPAGELSLQQLAAADVAPLAPDLPDTTWSETNLGQEPALLVSPVPGDEPTRRIYALHNGALYRVVFAPQLPVGAGPQAELARELHDLVSASFVFYR